ncbi:MAG: alpha/beta hydrolase [Pseudomonadota bacterium]
MTLSDRLFRFSKTIAKRVPPVGEVIEGIHLVQAGPTGECPVVLIHGASGNLRDWQTSIMPGLARDHNIIAVDRPGFGYSDALPGHGARLDDQITAIRRAIHALGHRRYLLGGHSYGGSLVMRWVLNHPDEVAGILVLSAPVMDWGGSGVGAHYQVGGRPMTGDVLCRLVPLLAGPGYINGAIKEVFHPQSPPVDYIQDGGVELALRPQTFRANAAMMLQLYPQVVEQARRYTEITCPVEIVHGDADAIVPARIHAIPLSQLLPHARLTQVPGVGHMPHHAAPETVIQALSRLSDRANEDRALVPLAHRKTGAA